MSAEFDRSNISIIPKGLAVLLETRGQLSFRVMVVDRQN
jgi:hypothetical protein